jgi:5-methyltetrahydrofolate--homocysteine methyltransferase
MNEQLLKQLFDAILEGDQHGAATRVQAAIDAGIDPAEILNQGMVAAMSEVGRLFEMGEYYVPEMLIAARAMQASMALLKPKLIQNNVKSAGKVVIGTVKGDLHDIGKNLVALMLEGAGFEIIDLGTDVSPEKFVEVIRSENRCLVGLSALLTTTMSSMKSIIDAIKEAGLRAQVKIMIGGAPVTEAFAQQIGADGFASDASRAVALARSLLEAA